MPTQQELLRLIGACGVTCGTCSGYVNGTVVTQSRQLRQSLEGFAAVAEELASFRSAFKHYPAFVQVLDEITAGACQGCHGGCQPKPGCYVAPCTREKGIDWCWQCAEFPCEHVHFSGRMQRVWLSANRAMAEIGVAAYWEQVKDRPHYANHVAPDQPSLWGES